MVEDNLTQLKTMQFILGMITDEKRLRGTRQQPTDK
jgi:hypothetical protein